MEECGWRYSADEAGFGAENGNQESQRGSNARMGARSNPLNLNPRPWIRGSAIMRKSTIDTADETGC